MNEQQKELLKQIVNDKYSVGAFSGMVYNQFMAFKLKGLNVPIESLVTDALDVRLKMEELANGKESKSE